MEYLVAHHQLLREFNNASYWPKHVLVEYTWEHSLLVNAVGGLYLLFATGRPPLLSQSPDNPISHPDSEPCSVVCCHTWTAASRPLPSGAVWETQPSS